MIINEIYNIKNGEMRLHNGNTVKIAYIDGATSENTFNIKDTLKSKYDAKWFKNLKAWGWYLNDNPLDVYQNKIKPCLEYLTSIENTDNGEKRNFIQIIDELLKELGISNVNSTPSTDGDGVKPMPKEEIMDKLSSFKEKLMLSINDEEFKKAIAPIIKFKKAQGHAFSIQNSILVWIQDPKATMVKARGRWAKVNRGVKNGAPTISLWYPIFGDKLSKAQKDGITKSYLAVCRVKNVNDLTPGQKEELDVKLSSGNKLEGYSLVSSFYDYRFTYQLEGKEDLVGDPNADIPWYDDSSKETPETIRLVDTICEVIKDSGVKLNYVEDLGGARGVSKSGVIEVLSNVPKNIGLMNTLTHEFSHELLHQRYLKDSHKDKKYSDLFVGTSKGRASVEQQAELSAWTVMQYYGYEMPTNLNYVAIWGLDSDNASYVFDSIIRAAEYIIKQMEKKMNNINESKKIFEGKMISAYELAQKVGMGDLYLKSKRKNERVAESTIKITESEIKSMIKEALNRIMK